MVLSAMTALVGFEEPSSTLLLASLVLAFAAPVAILVHLVGTNELTRHDKRIWIRQLAGPRAARAFSAYLTSHDRSATAERLAAEALARSQDRRTNEPRLGSQAASLAHAEGSRPRPGLELIGPG
jgi:hypothetical protein